MPGTTHPIVDDLRSAFQQLEGMAVLDEVVLGYLFGSHARGQAGPLSDIDIAVLLADTVTEASAFEQRLTLMDEISHRLRTNAVDVVVLNHAPLALAYRVLRDGVLIYCRDELKRIEFTARTVNMYLDFEPFLKRQERAILERARKGELLNGHNPHRGALERYRRLRERLKGPAEPDL